MMIDPAAVVVADPTIVADPVGRAAVIAIGVLAAVLVPVVAYLGVLLAKRIKAATGLDLTDDVRAVARAAVGFAEQWAVKRVGESKLTPPGSEKMRAASTWFTETAIAKGWPEWAAKKGEEWIEAQLGEQRSTTMVITPTPPGPS